MRAIGRVKLSCVGRPPPGRPFIAGRPKVREHSRTSWAAAVYLASLPDSSRNFRLKWDISQPLPTGDNLYFISLSKMSLILRPHRLHSVFDDMFHDLQSLERGVLPYWFNSGDNVHIANTTADVVDDEKKFGVSLDVSQFKPEELKVNLDGRVLTIEGTHERRDQNNYMQR